MWKWLQILTRKIDFTKNIYILIDQMKTCCIWIYGPNKNIKVQ
jgi:hypothetical protein